MKRVSVRGVIIVDQLIYLLYREKQQDGKIKKYYSLPGGGVENGETKEEALLREIKEEFSVHVQVGQYLGMVEDENSIQYFYSCTYLNGEFQLGGEEALQNCSENYYEIRKIPIRELKQINIYYQDIIDKAINNQGGEKFYEK